MATQSVTKAIESNRARLKAQVLASVPASDIAQTPQEVEFLLTYRKASEADKRRMQKLLRAGVAGLLPAPDVARAMTVEQVRAFADALPEVQA